MMKKRIIGGIVSICLIIIGLASFYFTNKPKNNDINVDQIVDLNLDCKAAFLMEESTQKVIYAKNETAKMHPASMTKMMGLLLVCEAIENKEISLNDMVSISSDAASMGGSQVFLQPLEQFSVEELIKCVCIASANDAMYALSEKVGTTNANFITMMNNKSKTLNLENTNFVNVTGFDDDEHYTCAKDMAMIAYELLKHKEIILKYTSIYDDYIRQDTPQPFWLVNTNKMVRYYEGMDGLKTGYTTKAGSCLTATAKRNNVRLISVIMNAKDSQTRNNLTKTLLDYGFSKIKSSLLYNKDSEIATIDLDKAKNEKVKIYTPNDIYLVYEGSLKENEIKKEVIINNAIMAPLKANDEIGFLRIRYGDDVHDYVLIVKEDIESLNTLDLFKDYIRNILF